MGKTIEIKNPIVGALVLILILAIEYFVMGFGWIAVGATAVLYAVIYYQSYWGKNKKPEEAQETAQPQQEQQPQQPRQ